MTIVTIASAAPGRFSGLVLVACSLLGPADLAAQTIEGVLLDRSTDQPIPLGLVTLLTADGDSVASALTDEAGRFRVGSPTGGDFLLAATALGYRSTVAASLFTIAGGGGMSLQFRIEPLAVLLEGITVEAERSLIRQPKLVQNGFVERVESGFGRFITPHDIETSHATSSAELLARTGRVTTRYGVGGEEILMRGTGGYCSPRLYVDGFQVRLGPGAPLDGIAPLSVLDAVEVYRSGAEAPLQYGGTSGGCGVILIWTKSR